MQEIATEDWAFRQIGVDVGLPLVEPYETTPEFPVNLYSLGPNGCFVAAGKESAVVGNIKDVVQALETKSEAKTTTLSLPGLLIVQILSNGTQFVVYNDKNELMLYSTSGDKQWAAVVPGIVEIRANPTKPAFAYVAEEKAYVVDSVLTEAGPANHIAYSPSGELALATTDKIAIGSTTVDPASSEKLVYLDYVGTNLFSVHLKDSDDEGEYDVFLRKGSQWEQIEDATPPFGAEDRSLAFYVGSIESWAKETVFAAIASKSTDIELATPQELLRPLEDSDRGVMPYDGDDISPVGAAFWLGSTEPVPEPFPGVEKSNPCPVWTILSSEGALIAWRLVSRTTLTASLPKIIVASGALSVASKADKAAPAAPASATTEKPQTKSSPSNPSSPSKTPPGPASESATSKPLPQDAAKTASPFGPLKSNFGSSWGSSNAFGSDNKEAAAFGKPSAFGGTSTAFGGTSTAFGGTSTAFDGTSTAFGGTSTAFGSTASGGTAFGAKDDKASASPFANFASSTPFGQTPSKDSTPAFAKEDAGPAKEPPKTVFGAQGSAFTPSKPSPFGNVPPSKSTSSPFAALKSGEKTVSPFGPAKPQDTKRVSPFGNVPPAASSGSPFAALKPGDTKTASPFASAAKTESPFAALKPNDTKTASPFAALKPGETKTAFASPTKSESPFSAFKSQDTKSVFGAGSSISKSDEPKFGSSQKGSIFGSDNKSAFGVADDKKPLFGTNKTGSPFGLSSNITSSGKDDAKEKPLFGATESLGKLSFGSEPETSEPKAEAKAETEPETTAAAKAETKDGKAETEPETKAATESSSEPASLFKPFGETKSTGLFSQHSQPASQQPLFSKPEGTSLFGNKKLFPTSESATPAGSDSKDAQDKPAAEPAVSVPESKPEASGLQSRFASSSKPETGSKPGPSSVPSPKPNPLSATVRPTPRATALKNRFPPQDDPSESESGESESDESESGSESDDAGPSEPADNSLFGRMRPRSPTQSDQDDYSETNSEVSETGSYNNERHGYDDDDEDDDDEDEDDDREDDDQDNEDDDDEDDEEGEENEDEDEDEDESEGMSDADVVSHDSGASVQSLPDSPIARTGPVDETKWHETSHIVEPPFEEPFEKVDSPEPEEAIPIFDPFEETFAQDPPADGNMLPFKVIDEVEVEDLDRIYGETNQLFQVIDYNLQILERSCERAHMPSKSEVPVAERPPLDLESWTILDMDGLSERFGRLQTKTKLQLLSPQEIQEVEGLRKDASAAVNAAVAIGEEIGIVQEQNGAEACEFRSLPLATAKLQQKLRDQNGALISSLDKAEGAILSARARNVRARPADLALSANILDRQIKDAAARVRSVEQASQSRPQGNVNKLNASLLALDITDAKDRFVCRQQQRQSVANISKQLQQRPN